MATPETRNTVVSAPQGAPPLASGMLIQRCAPTAPFLPSAGPDARGRLVCHWPAAGTDANLPVFARLSGPDGSIPGWENHLLAQDGAELSAFILDDLPPGGPYRLELSRGDERLCFDDLWVGDLWLLAGQSNMEGVGNLIDAPTPAPWVRSLAMARVWEEARDPLHYLRESPDPVHHQGEFEDAQTAQRKKPLQTKGTGLGVWFGLEMYRRTGVPQGLIATAHGGTRMDEWDPALAALEGESLYGSLLLSLKAAGQTPAGLLWHQGCSDTWSALCDSYRNKMEGFVAALRRDTGYADLPVVMAQIAREVGRSVDVASWTRVVDQQWRLPERIARLDCIPTADLEMDDWIHLSGRAHATLARRMANSAERFLYPDRPLLPPPRPLRARCGFDRWSTWIDIDFEHVVGGLESRGTTGGFTLANREGKEARYVYQARCAGSTVRLRLTCDELDGLYVHHGLGVEPFINTFDMRGMPLPVFGPLEIGELPPRSNWFRCWEIQAPQQLSAPAGKGQTDARPEPEGRPLRRFFDGWWKVQVPGLKDSGPGSIAICRSELFCPEDMTMDALIGHDGPLSMWIDAELIYQSDTFPPFATQDEFRAPVQCAAGKHRVTVALGYGSGASDGFFLRFLRTDGGHLRPSCSLAAGEIGV